jgi:aminomethyltransferase
MLAVQGPKARERVKSALPADLQTPALALAPFYCCWNEQFFVARTGYTGEDGFEIILPADQAPALWDTLLANHINPIGLGARDTLRLEAAMNLYGTDMDEQYSPLESGLAWTVAWSPEDRDFIGRKALQHQKEQGQHHVLKGLILLEKGVLRHQQTVIVEGLGEGYITSGTFSPSLGQAIALARLPQSDYQHVTVMIRNKPLTAKVVKPPFVRYGRICFK